jgi:hypothetical protein
MWENKKEYVIKVVGDTSKICSLERNYRYSKVYLLKKKEELIELETTDLIISTLELKKYDVDYLVFWRSLLKDWKNLPVLFLLSEEDMEIVNCYDGPFRDEDPYLFDFISINCKTGAFMNRVSILLRVRERIL